MRLRLIRHATLLVRLAGHCLVVDPMLDPAGARPPVPDTPNPVPNPLVELPEPPEIVVQGLTAVLVTHLHQDHLDATAIALAPKDVPVFCAPGDAGKLREHGFADVRPVEGAVEWEGLRIASTGGVHGPLGPSPGTRSGATRCAPRSTPTRPTSSWSTPAARASSTATHSS
jgi:L-ascorbate metabolism protein UlaG (beta-lactamase superfamily)